MNSSEKGTYTPAEKWVKSIHPKSPGRKTWACASNPRRMNRNCDSSWQVTTQQNNIKFLPCSYEDDLRETSPKIASIELEHQKGMGSLEKKKILGSQAMLRNWHSIQGIVTCVSLPHLWLLYCVLHMPKTSHIGLWVLAPQDPALLNLDLLRSFPDYHHPPISLSFSPQHFPVPALDTQ